MSKSKRLITYFSEKIKKNKEKSFIEKIIIEDIGKKAAILHLEQLNYDLECILEGIASENCSRIIREKIKENYNTINELRY